MLQKVTVINHLGESVIIEPRSPEKSGFLVRSIDGLNPSRADVNMSDISQADGSRFDSSRVTSRNIVFTLGFWETSLSIEEMRVLSYKYFPIRRQITMIFETDTRIATTYGYVESNEITIFSREEQAVISVMCPDAYLYSVTKEITAFSSVTAAFEFPFSNESLVTPLLVMSTLSQYFSKVIIYSGDVDIGMVIKIHAIGSASELSIINIVTGGSLVIDSTKLAAIVGSDISAGDDIIISTVIGEKYVILIRSGTTYNIFNAVDSYPEWFRLYEGDNLFSYDADSGLSNLQFQIENRIAYEGI